MQSDLWKKFLKNRMAVAGSLLVFGLFFTAVFAPLLAPYEPTEIHLDRILAPPSAAHWFGTDQLGRDIFSRMIWGSRIS
ncbi:MAG: peptide ABC transporter permease, partial [Syntrophales bacterium]